MGKQIINGIEYSGSGAANASQLPYDNTKSTKQAIDELNSNIPFVLWEAEDINDDSTYPQSGTINLNTDDWDELEIFAVKRLDSDKMVKSVKYSKNEKYRIILLDFIGSNGNNLTRTIRTFTVSSDFLSISMGSCTSHIQGNSESTQSARVRPYRIIGYKHIK